VSSTLKEIHVEDGVANPDYEHPACEGDYFTERYQCVACGYVLKDENDNVIDSLEKLGEWFAERT
jgi:hypothetical protein